MSELKNPFAIEIIDEEKAQDESSNPFAIEIVDDEKDASYKEQPSLPTVDPVLPKKEEKPQRQIPKPEAIETRSFESFAKDEEFINKIDNYVMSRFGEEELQGPDESNEDYLNRFLTHWRNQENLIILGQELDWVRSADVEDLENYTDIVTQLQALPNIYEEGGAGMLGAMFDYTVSFASDPTSVLSAFTGFFGGQAARIAVKETIKEMAERGVQEISKKQMKSIAAKEARKAALKPLAVEAAGVGGLGVARSYQQQEMDIATKQREDYSAAEAAISGGVEAGLGFGLGRIFAGSEGKNIARELLMGNSNNVANRVLKESASNTAREILDFDVIQGRKILDRFDRTGLTESQIQVELQKRVTTVAQNILQDMKEQGADLSWAIKTSDETGKPPKASQVIGTILRDEVDIDADILSGAIRRAGLTESEFIEAAGTSLSDAAKTMQAFSPTGKWLKKLRELDPEVAKEIDTIFGKENNTIKFLSTAGQIYYKFDRTRRALMVSQLSTTARNVGTGVMRLGMEGSANFLESLMFQTGKALSGGDIGVGATARGMRNIYRDTFGVLTNLVETGRTREISDMLLAHNPKMARKIDRSLAEVGADEDIHKIARFTNTLNTMQDQFFRRAVFLESVEKQLRRVGQDPVEFYKTGKALPPSVMKRATEEALSFTFTRMPSEKAGGVEGVASRFIKFNEALGPLPLPVGTAALPFARFMYNAMEFTAGYSPLGLSKGVYRGVMQGARKAAGKGTDPASMQKFREELSKGIVGSAALFAAYEYRKQNQDLKWYDVEVSEGVTVDARPLYPIAPYLAIGDAIVKWENSLKGEENNLGDMEFQSQLLEGVAGVQARTGASSFIIDNFFGDDGLVSILKSGDSVDVKTEKAAEYMGRFVGELFGGFTTPLRTLNDIRAAVDPEAAKVRDYTQTEEMGAVARGLDIMTQTVQKDIPFLSERLPERESATQERTPSRQSPLFKQLGGISLSERRSKIQSALEAHGLDEYKIFQSTTDKAADAYVKRSLGPLIELQLSYILESDTFKSLNKAGRTQALKNRFSQYQKMARLQGEAYARQDAPSKGRGFTPFDRAKWSKVPKLQRRLANDAYVQKYGYTVEEMQEREPQYNHYAIGTFYARGFKNL